MKRIFFLTAVLIGGCLWSGCTITTLHSGEVGVRFGNEITFFHRAAQTGVYPARGPIPECVAAKMPEETS